MLVLAVVEKELCEMLKVKVLSTHLHKVTCMLTTLYTAGQAKL